MAASFTVVTCHAGDHFWVEQLTARIDRSTDPAVVREIVVVDQDRTPAGRAVLDRLPRVGRVVDFTPHAGQVERLGHDHPSALNQAVRLPFESTHLVVMDTDALPIRPDWMALIAARLEHHDCLVARDPSTFGLSHPSFMVLPVSAACTLDFSEGVEEVGLDTGRLAGLQLTRAGLVVDFLGPKPGFSGWRGHLYLDRAVYHHGHGSFLTSRHAPHRARVEADDERFFRRQIEADRFELDRRQRLRFTARRVGRALPRAARDLSRRSRGPATDRAG